MLERIFHPTDLTRGSEPAFHHALKIALATGGQLDILHVEPTYEAEKWDEFPHVRDTLVKWGHLSEDSSHSEVEETGVWVRKGVATSANPAHALVDHLEKHPADAIVLASHRLKGMERFMHNNIANEVARLAHTLALFVPFGCQGFVSPNDGSAKLEHVLIPVDASPHPQPAIDKAAELVRTLGARAVIFTLLHVGPAHDIPQVKLPEGDDWRWRTEGRQGSPVEVILEVANSEKADLIAVATEGRAGILDALRGSTTDRLLRGTQVPLLAVPSRSSSVELI